MMTCIIETAIALALVAVVLIAIAALTLAAYAFCLLALGLPPDDAVFIASSVVILAAILIGLVVSAAAP
jgi:hypothetical protein